MSSEEEDKPVTETPGNALSLINRYHAAWLEHGTRITQRQNVIQIYLATAGIIFGFYFHATTNSTGQTEAISYFLLLGITFLSLSHASMIWMHNRVIQNLCSFMMKCEKHFQSAIKAEGGDTNDLFYFFDANNGKVPPFHVKQRIMNRIVSSIIFAVVILTAIMRLVHK
jgi:hypothetical protein